MNNINDKLLDNYAKILLADYDNKTPGTIFKENIKITY